MNKKRQKELEAKGFEVTTVSEFLGLSNLETQIIELRLSLSNALKNRRLQSNVSQKEHAKLLNTSQSRLAKMEAGDKGVSLDLLIKSLFKSGRTVRNCR